jgi:hypothetical protein
MDLRLQPQPRAQLEPIGPQHLITGKFFHQGAHQSAARAEDKIRVMSKWFPFEEPFCLNVGALGVRQQGCVIRIPGPKSF